jgi:hypothetical protein
VRKIALKPELETVEDMLKLASLLIAGGVSHLQMMWHSPSLLPGCSPFVNTMGDRDRLLSVIRGFITRLRQEVPVRFVTVSEAAERVAEKEKPS